VLLALLRLLAVARERADVDSADAIQQQVSTLRRAAERAVQDPSERSYVLERADELR
jgi:hypothetical protein